MRTVGLSRVPGVGVGFGSWLIKKLLSEVFTALWYNVDGTEMEEMFGGDPLTLSSDPGESYIPATFAGTITAPDIAGYKTADTNNILYDGGGTANALGVSDFIDTDLERIPVKYDNNAPHNIRMIGLFDPTVYPSLSESDKKRISSYMDLWAFYWGVWYDAGAIKENREF